MNPSVLMFAQVLGVILAAIIPLAAIVVGVNRLTRGSRIGTPPPLEDQRLTRLEQTVDSIAIEVERISESQRFIAKLLSERSKEPSQLPPPT